jgi:hypothetical protein
MASASWRSDSTALVQHHSNERKPCRQLARRASGLTQLGSLQAGYAPAVQTAQKARFAESRRRRSERSSRPLGFRRFRITIDSSGQAPHEFPVRGSPKHDLRMALRVDDDGSDNSTIHDVCTLDRDVSCFLARLWITEHNVVPNDRTSCRGTIFVTDYTIANKSDVFVRSIENTIMLELEDCITVRIVEFKLVLTRLVSSYPYDSGAAGEVDIETRKRGETSPSRYLPRGLASATPAACDLEHERSVTLLGRQPRLELLQKFVPVGAAPTRAKVEPLCRIVAIGLGTAVVADWDKRAGYQAGIRIECELPTADNVAKGCGIAILIGEVVEKEDRHRTIEGGVEGVTDASH